MLTPLLLIREPLRWRPIFLVALVNLVVFSISLAIYRPQDILAGYPNMLQYWTAQPAVFGQYFQLMLWPSGLSIDHDFGSASVRESLLGLTLILVLAMTAWRLRKRNPLVGCGVVWLFLALLPASLIPNSDLINESRLYFPMVGFCLFAGAVLIPDRRQVRYGWTRLLMGLWMLLMLPKTLERNALWQDDLALWQDAALKNPGKVRVHYNLGVALARKGDIQEARKRFHTALALNPQDDMSYAGLGYCAEVVGNLESARSLYGTAVDWNARNRYAHEGLQRLQASSFGGAERGATQQLIMRSTPGKASGIQSEIF